MVIDGVGSVTGGQKPESIAKCAIYRFTIMAYQSERLARTEVGLEWGRGHTRRENITPEAKTGNDRDGLFWGEMGTSVL